MKAERSYSVSHLIQFACGTAAILAMASCSTVPQNPTEANEPPRKLAIQPETKWPTSAAWWKSPDATALVSSNPYTENAARMDSDAKVTSVQRQGSDSSVITFSPLKSSSITITLHGPARLAEFLAVGQHVNLIFDQAGHIKEIGDMPELKSWTKSGSRHRLELTTQGGKTYHLFAGDGQLFYGIGDLPSERNATRLAQQYDQWTTPTSGKRYADLSQAEKTVDLRNRVGFEVILTPRGVIFYTGSGYGGGEEAEPEWILPTSASEGF